MWAAELAGTGVRVVNVDPGEMDTRMHADAIPDADRATLADPARVAARDRRAAAGRAGAGAGRARRDPSAGPQTQASP